MVLPEMLPEPRIGRFFGEDSTSGNPGENWQLNGNGPAKAPLSEDSKSGAGQPVEGSNPLPSASAHTAVASSVIATTCGGVFH